MGAGRRGPGQDQSDDFCGQDAEHERSDPALGALEGDGLEQAFWRLGRPAFVAVMESADFGHLHDPTGR